MIDFEFWLFGNKKVPGPGLPPPPEKKVGRPVVQPVAGARLINPVTRAYEWDIARSRPAGASSDITDTELAECAARGLLNVTWIVALKLARVQGKTIAQAAKSVGCSPSYAQKVYAALSKFEEK